jgi:hypothetical protein
MTKDDLALPGMPVLPDVIECPEEELVTLAQQLRCAHCEAEPGVWCRTRKSHGAVKLHAARMLVTQAIFELGVTHGRHLESIARDAEYAAEIRDEAS